MTSNEASLATLRSEIEQGLDDVFAGTRRVAVLQYPLDANVGNHLMWAAFTSYLARRGIRLAYAAHTGDLDVHDLRRAIGSDPIVFLGGVTVSRLWPEHAATKRTVARAFPRNRLVSLPATVMFVDADDAAGAADVFGDHPDVILFGRDPVSAANAREVFPGSVDVRCLHDLALLVSPRERGAAAEAAVLWQHRYDAEGVDAAVPEGVPTFDWTWRVWRSTWRGSGFMHLAGLLSLGRRAARRARPVRRVNMGISWLYRHATAAIIAHGEQVLDGANVIVTDRLHTHVLAALRGQPVVLMPDRYGKNRAVYDYSTARFSNVHWADSSEAALALARALAADANAASSP